MNTLLCSAGIIVCAGMAAFAESISLTPSADTTLFENFPDNNLGGITTVAAGTTAHDFLSRALIKFDVAGQIPANMVITSARLRLKVVRLPLGPEESTFSVRRMLRNWTEGNKSFGNLGEPASAGQTTWNSRFHSTTPWDIPGAAAGTEFSSVASSSADVFDLGEVVFASSPALVADVQQWLTNPSQNFGWILMSDSEELNSTARRFGAREDGPNAPVLEIEYSQPFRIGNVARSGGNFGFTFPVEPLFTYTVEARTSLSAGSWNLLTNFTETVNSYDAVISDAIAPPSRFYRVHKAPCNCQ